MGLVQRFRTELNDIKDKKDLDAFVKEKGNLLPDNIMMWKDLFSSIPEDPDK